MNNEILTERIYLHLIKNSANNINEEVYERTLYGVPLQFIKDSAKTLLQIRKLEVDSEIILDLVQPTGFLSILRTPEDYLLTLVIKDQKSREFHIKKSTEVMKRVIELLKDQITVGRKNLKAQYKNDKHNTK